MAHDDMRANAHAQLDQLFDVLAGEGAEAFAVALFVEAAIPGVARRDGTLFVSGKGVVPDVTEREARAFMRGVYENARKLRDQREPLVTAVTHVEEGD